jgi:hypothetical protein
MISDGLRPPLFIRTRLRKHEEVNYFTAFSKVPMTPLEKLRLGWFLAVTLAGFF